VERAHTVAAQRRAGLPEATVATRSAGEPREPSSSIRMARIAPIAIGIRGPKFAA